MTLLSTALTSLLAASAVQAGPISRRAAAGLNAAAKAAGLEYFGSATDNPELTDSDYMTILNNSDQFGQITPGNSMKWDTIEPSRGTFSFTKGDAIADLAEQNNQKLRCHNLVWHNQLPSWVSSGGFDNATLVEILQNHITKEVTHYKGRCYHWDVVNEALDDDGNYRDNVFYTTIGEAYIPIAFAAAAAADPDAKLYYNDFSIEWSSTKHTNAVNIVKLVQSYGVKIDGVGMQAHFTVGQTVTQDAMESAIQDFADLGVEVAITELDIRTTTPATNDALEQQSTDYQTIVNACLANSACVGITIWDYTDKYSWVPKTFPGYGAALPWDENLKTKPAYDGILLALGSGTSGASPSSSSSNTNNTSSSPSTPSASTPAAQTASVQASFQATIVAFTPTAAAVVATPTAASSVAETSSSASPSISTSASAGPRQGKSCRRRRSKKRAAAALSS
ncbi:glycoside hydrolase superfamily [Phyllosticta citriasiana]|uniref:glycoside hydrolase superfamily n=1 Tax=Phyllosticta citriasiana TaxID=595635 RepID=UPI0030FD2D26